MSTAVGTPVSIPVRDAPGGTLPPVRPGPARDATAVAALALGVSAAGAARPSLWFDEAATISAATRPATGLWEMLGNIDAVHGLYYLLMHGWFAVFPATEFASRLSSSLAVALAAAGVVVLGRQLFGRPTALTAGVVFAILPRVTWAGMETRSYALTMAAAVWLTVLCVRAARSGGRSTWAAYAGLLATSVLLNVFLVLMAPVHAAVVAACARAPRTGRHWAAATVVALSGTVPFLMFSQTQLFQVRWIAPLGPETVGKILVDQYFDHALPFALLSAVMIIAGLLCLGPAQRQPAAVLLCWIAIPTAALLAYSALRHPVYYPRYLSFTAPAFALLLGLCVVAVARSRVFVTVTVLIFAVAAVPNYLAQRGPYAKERMDYSQVADVIDRHARPGDCLVMDNSAAWMPGPIRPLLAARPAAFHKLRDYGRGRSAADRKMLWDGHAAIWSWADKMPECPALWTITERDSAVPGYQRGPSLEPGPRLGRAMAYQVPSRFGFRVVERWQFSFAQVAKAVRTAS